jgi:hypothetical protein
MGILGTILIGIGAVLCAFALLAAFTPIAIIAPLVGAVFVGGGVLCLGLRPRPPLPPPGSSQRLPE